MTITIIGQGLAGTLLAWEAYFQHIPFTITDDGKHNASKTAGGLIDPLAGQRYLQAWKAQEVIPVALAFYQKIESILGLKVLHLKNSIRFFTSDSDKELWIKKQHHPSVGHYFIHPQKVFFPEHIHAPLGGIEVTPSGNLDTKLFLEASARFFKTLDRFDTQNTPLTIFCEGYRAQFNPYFQHLPWNSSKGNVLTLNTTLPDTHILHKGKWILPLGNRQFKLGSTYSIDISTETPDPDSQSELLGFLSQFNKANDTVVIGHEAGIRPILKDNRPVLGRHPHHSNVAIFNGLGSRGVSLGPTLAKQLLNHLIHDAPLEKEVSLERFRL